MHRCRGDSIKEIVRELGSSFNVRWSRKSSVRAATAVVKLWERTCTAQRMTPQRSPFQADQAGIGRGSARAFAATTNTIPALRRNDRSASRTSTAADERGYTAETRTQSRRSKTAGAAHERLEKHQRTAESDSRWSEEASGGVWGILYSLILSAVLSSLG